MIDIQHGDAILLRTRVSQFLNAASGIGPDIRVVPQAHRDPAVSDEIWWVERLAGSGAVQHGDAVLLRTRVNHFLNAASGIGPGVRVAPQAHRDPAVSDEIWWVERLAGSGAVQQSASDQAA